MSRYATNRQLDAEEMVQELVEALEGLMTEAPFGPATNPEINWGKEVLERDNVWIEARAVLSRARGEQS